MVTPARWLWWLCFAGIWLGAVVRVAQVPVWGSTDRGDFWRVIDTAGLAPARAADPTRVTRWWQIKPTALGEHPSSAAWLAWVATRLPGITQPRDMVDVRQVGGLLLAIMLGCCLWLRRAGPSVAAAGVLLSWIVLDPGYLRFFNSFYAEGCMFTGLFGLCLGCLRPAPGAARLAAMVGLAVLVSWAKQPCAPIAAAFAVPAIVSAIREPAARLRMGMFAATLLVVSASSLAHFGAGRGHRFPAQNGFNAVFTGIALVSREPERVLAELGLPSGLHTLIGKDAFAPEVPTSALSAAAHVSRLRIAGQYLREPQTLLRVAKRAGRMLAFDPPWVIGQWEDGRESVLARELSFATFGRARAALLRGGPAWVWTWLALLSLWLALRLRRWDAMTTTLLSLWLVFFSQLIVSVLGDGLFSLSRHLLGARFAFDAMLVLVFVDVVRGPMAVAMRAASARLAPVMPRILVERHRGGHAGI